MDVYINKDHLALAKNIEVYLKLKPPDCSLFSSDYEEIPIHKEILYQTRFMQEILKSLDCCCCKVEIFCPSLTKHDLEIVVQFLYNGKLLNNRSHTVEKENVRNLVELFGFPICMKNGEIHSDYKILSKYEEGISLEKEQKIKEELIPSPLFEQDSTYDEING